MKLLRNLTIFTSVLFAVTICSAICASAYSDQYSSETGFYVFYTVVTKDKLSEPPPTVGEVRETAPDSGVLTLLLPDGRRIESEIPSTRTVYYGGSRGSEYTEYSTVTWQIYDSYGNNISELDWGKIYPKKDEHTERSHSYLPVYYNGNLFVRRATDSSESYAIKLNEQTFDIIEDLGPYYDANLFDLSAPVYCEDDSHSECNGYEITPGSYIIADRYTNSATDSPEFMPLKNDKFFSYSCDGTRFVNIKCPDNSLNIAHYIVNGVNCITIRFSENDQIYYAAYSIDTLNQLWNEYCDNVPYVYLNGTKLCFANQPVIIDGTTFMPLRFLLECAGAEITWNEETSSADIEYLGKNITITKDSDTVFIDGEQITLNTPARIIDDRMMIPLRFISEGLGFNVNWDANTRSVYVDVIPDNITRYFTPFPTFERPTYNVVVNGIKTEAVLSCEGHTLLSDRVINKFFTLYDNESEPTNSLYLYGGRENYELILDLDKDEQYAISLWDTDIDSPMKMRYPLPDTFYIYNGIKLPAYDIPIGVHLNPISALPCNYFCIEEIADMMDCMHFEWIEEYNTLYVYISDDMVTYDEALKALLDKKGIKYDTEYRGDYFKDIEAMQPYSDYDLSKLVNAGINAYIIKESDYPDGRLRPTRTISKVDFERLLWNTHNNYKYDSSERNEPLTREEFNKVLGDL